MSGLDPCRYCGSVPTQVIVLNGGSSSGKSGIARCLQAVLPDTWLTFGTDTLVEAMAVLEAGLARWFDEQGVDLE